MIQAFSVSCAGGHSHNEDAFAVQPHPQDPNCWLCVVADGQGGHAGGQEASWLVCKTLIESAGRHAAKRLMEISRWELLFREADGAVRADAVAGLTTLVDFCVTSTAICGGSNGDSAVVLFDLQRGPVELTRNQVKNPPVGSGNAAFTPFAAMLTGAWMMAAMTDGVWKYCGWDRINKVGAKLRGQAFIDELLEYARLGESGKLQDDFTLVVLQTD
jgi:PPM family protein phosphatase